MAAVKQYILNVLIAFDQLVNALVGGAPDETLSASAWKGETQGRTVPRFFRKLIDALFYPFQKDHCREAYEAELRREQLPASYRSQGEP
jgi:hypothetical protein